MFAQETLEMRSRTSAIASRTLELRETEQCVRRTWRQRVLHDNAPIIALGTCGRNAERGAPEQRLCITGRFTGRYCEQRIDHSPAGSILARGHHLVCANQNRICRWRVSLGHGTRRHCEERNQR
jgi:hypothetical protein